VRAGDGARRRLTSPIFLGVLPFAAGAVVWTILVRAYHISPVFLPPLESVPAALRSMFIEQRVATDILISSLRVAAGFAVAVLLATPLGVLMGYSFRISQIFEPVVGFIRYMPVPVFIPLCLLWFGSGDLEKVIVIFLGAFFQLTLMVQDAAGGVRQDFYEAAVMLGAPRRALIFRILWPAALPQIFDSYRVCIGWAWTYLIVAEIVGATAGIGYYIIKAQRYLLVSQIFAAMAIIGLLGMTTDLLFGAGHNLLFPWAKKKRSFLT